ncbi:hypothetical protein M9Y10_010067 [Tritrichomonas musculus]|uniref:Uncharacterized protein n=1 Tax=Tritrichomonas musculus TaxID=1915356 RepID=A0ABR2IRN1_9EUKA
MTNNGEIIIEEEEDKDEINGADQVNETLEIKSIKDFNNLSIKAQHIIINKMVSTAKSQMFIDINNFLSFIIAYANKDEIQSFQIMSEHEPKITQVADNDGISVNSSLIQALYKSNILNSSDFKNHVSKFRKVVLNLRYPSPDFDHCYDT